MYQDILKRAWEIAWSRKKLWIFGLFAGVLLNSIYYNIVNLTAGGFGTYRVSAFISNARTLSSQFLRGLKNIFTTDPTNSIIFLVLIFVLIIILFIAFSLLTISTIALIENISGNSKQAPVSIVSSIRKSRKNFWPSFTIIFLSKIALVIVGFFVSFEFLSFLFSIENLGLRFAVFLLTFILQIFFFLLFQFIIIYSNAFVVLKGFRVRRAFLEGARMFFQYWVNSIEFAIILFLIGVGATIAGIIAASILSVPFIFLMLFFASSNMPILAIISLAAIIIIFSVILIVENALYATFQMAAWLGLHHTLSRGFQVHRLIDKIFSLFKK